MNNTFSYLGISVTRKHKDLFQENLITLLNQTKQTLTRWSTLSMSLVGCINSVKMTILPLFIPGSFFQLLDSVISSYLWRCKRPHLNKIHLQKTKATVWPYQTFIFIIGLLTCAALRFGPPVMASVTVLTGWRWSYSQTIVCQFLHFLDPHSHFPHLNQSETQWWNIL